MIEILQTRTAIRWLQLHQRRGGLSAAQNESEAALGSMQHNRARIGNGSARATGKKDNRFQYRTDMELTFNVRTPS